MPPPYGRLHDTVRATSAEAGYACAFSTRSGLNRGEEDPLRICRVDVNVTDAAGALRRKMRLMTDNGSLLSAGRCYARRVLARRRFE